MASESSLAGPAAKAAPQGPMLYIAGAFVLVGIALFGYLQYSSNQKPADIPLTPEAKAYVHNLKLDDVEMKATESYLKQTVVEIQGTIGNAMMRSDRHESGYALRFPRIVRLRPDKSAEDADTIEGAREIYEQQE